MRTKEAAFMSEPKKLLLVILLILLGTISVKAQKVSVGADPSVDLSKYKSYSWSNVAN
jgi:hypothetical protein